MKLREFIVTEAITPELQATDRESAVRELVTAMAAAGAIPSHAVEDLVVEVLKREDRGTTGFGNGVAVPHAKHRSIKRVSGALGRSVHGLDFKALDHQPVYIVFLMLSPEDQPQQHLQAMNIVFNSLQKEMFRRFLRQSTSREAIVDLLDEADQGK